MALTYANLKSRIANNALRNSPKTQSIKQILADILEQLQAQKKRKPFLDLLLDIVKDIDVPQNELQMAVDELMNDDFVVADEASAVLPNAPVVDEDAQSVAMDYEDGQIIGNRRKIDDLPSQTPRSQRQRRRPAEYP